MSRYDCICIVDKAVKLLFFRKKILNASSQFIYPSYAGHCQWYGFSVLVQNDNKTSKPKVAIANTNLSYFSIDVEIRFPGTCSAL